MSEVVAEKEKFENQIKLIENDRGSCYEISKNSEKKLKDDLIKLRGVIDAKRGEIQELNDLVEKLKNENENYRSQIKSSESNQLSNELFLKQIQDMQQSFNERENELLKENLLPSSLIYLFDEDILPINFIFFFH